MPSAVHAYRYKASLPRAIVAVAVGALAGGTLVSAAQYTAIHLGLGGGHYGGTVDGVVSTTVFGSLIFAVGLLAVSPVWLILDRLGHREPWMAALLGGGLSILAPVAFSLAITDLHSLPTLLDAQSVLEFLTPMAVTGVLVGLAVWRIAYRRTHVLPAQELLRGSRAPTGSASPLRG